MRLSLVALISTTDGAILKHKVSHNHLNILTGKKHPKIKPQAPTKNTNMDIWVVGTSN